MRDELPLKAQENAKGMPEMDDKSKTGELII
jgi:hypothetical protein